MCRLLITFENKNTKKIILDFLKQSTQCNKNTPGINNSRDKNKHIDGYGLSWFVNNKWKIHKNNCLYTKDSELENCLDNMPKKIVVGHIRKKKYGVSKIENTHPFLFENQIFLQNGSIKNFPKYTSILKNFIDPKYVSEIKGESDTEVLFYMFLTIRDNIESKFKKEEDIIVNGFNQLFGFFRKMNIEISANIIYANDNILAVTRYIYYDTTEYKTRQEPNSLYWNISNSGGVLISSEPLLKEYEIIPEQTITLINHKTNNMYQYQL
jgi:predicted glutamine amidotransferase